MGPSVRSILQQGIVFIGKKGGNNRKQKWHPGGRGRRLMENVISFQLFWDFSVITFAPMIDMSLWFKRSLISSFVSSPPNAIRDFFILLPGRQRRGQNDFKTIWPITLHGSLPPQFSPTISPFAARPPFFPSLWGSSHLFWKITNLGISCCCAQYRRKDGYEGVTYGTHMLL